MLQHLYILQICTYLIESFMEMNLSSFWFLLQSDTDRESLKTKDHCISAFLSMGLSSRVNLRINYRLKNRIFSIL